MYIFISMLIFRQRGNLRWEMLKNTCFSDSPDEQVHCLTGDTIIIGYERTVHEKRCGLEVRISTLWKTWLFCGLGFLHTFILADINNTQRVHFNTILAEETTWHTWLWLTSFSWQELDMKIIPRRWKKKYGEVWESGWGRVRRHSMSLALVP